MNILVKDAVISGFPEAKRSQESAQSAKARIGIGGGRTRICFLTFIIVANFTAFFQRFTPKKPICNFLINKSVSIYFIN